MFITTFESVSREGGTKTLVFNRSGHAGPHCIIFKLSDKFARMYPNGLILYGQKTGLPACKLACAQSECVLLQARPVKVLSSSGFAVRRSASSSLGKQSGEMCCTAQLGKMTT